MSIIASALILLQHPFLSATPTPKHDTNCDRTTSFTLLRWLEETPQEGPWSSLSPRNQNAPATAFQGQRPTMHHSFQNILTEPESPRQQANQQSILGAPTLAHPTRYELRSTAMAQRDASGEPPYKAQSLCAKPTRHRGRRSEASVWIKEMSAHCIRYTESISS